MGASISDKCHDVRLYNVQKFRGGVGVRYRMGVRWRGATLQSVAADEKILKRNEK